MHIVYFIQQFPPEVGAGAARASEMALRWRAAGADVTVVTAMPNRPQGRIYPEFQRKLFDEHDWKGIRVLRSWLFARPNAGTVATLSNNFSFGVTGFLHAALSLSDVDVVVSSSPPFICQLAGTLLARLKGATLVAELRDLWPDYIVEMGMVRRESGGGRILFALERWALDSATRVAVVTESFRQRLVDKGVPNERIDVFPNGVDLQRYTRVNQPPPLAGLDRDSSDLTLGYMGNFGRGQDLLTIVQAAERCVDAGLPVRFVLAGDGPERQKIEAAARQLPADRLRILGTISKRDTPVFYNLCDACLVPLAPLAVLEETVPSKLFEIMACERPVLASVAGETARLVREARCGLVSAPGSAPALVESVMTFLGLSRTQRERMGSEGRSFVAGRFDRARIADTYLDALKRAAHEP